MQISQEKVHVSPLVKICGITKQEQCLAIAEAGADLIGINFWAKSKRFLPLEQRAWLQEAKRQIPLVGVFVNPTLGELEGLVECISMIQLHGDETPEFVEKVKGLDLPVIKAFQIKDHTSLESISQYPVDDVLLDAYHHTERGGLGEVFPWQLANDFKRMHPQKRIFLAGGLHPHNVNLAVAGVQPYAVDVASGVEGSTPGIKDLEKVQQFINAAKLHAFRSTVR